MRELVHGLLILPINEDRLKAGFTQAALGHKVCWTTILFQTLNFQITNHKIFSLKIVFSGLFLNFQKLE